MNLPINQVAAHLHAVSPDLATRLLLDSRVVDLPLSYNPIVVALFSLKPFFFNGLK
jgi:hypothetical protein